MTKYNSTIITFVSFCTAYPYLQVHNTLIPWETREYASLATNVYHLVPCGVPCEKDSRLCAARVELHGVTIRLEMRLDVHMGAHGQELCWPHLHGYLEGSCRPTGTMQRLARVPT